MLTEVRYNEDEYEFPCLLVLGSFDAIHKGHAELLKKAKLQAKINGLDLGVMVFKSGKSGSQICSYEEKLALIEQYNAKFVLSVDFTDEFKKTAPLDFLQTVEEKLNVKAYVSGKDFRFGAGAKGKSSTLKNYGEDEDNGVWYLPVKDVTDENGEKISSTKIKALLENGEIVAANALLGRNYSVTASVVSTAGYGEVTALTLAYPEGKVKIKDGVYTAKCTVSGTEYEGVANCGENFELHIKNFNVPEDGTITVEFTDCYEGVNEISAAPAAAPVEELAVTDETPEEQPVPEEPAAPIEETVAQPEEEVVLETQVETVEEQPAAPVKEEAEEPEAEVFADDGGFDDDYVEEDFADEQPAEEITEEVKPEEPAENNEEVTEEAPETTDTKENEEPID